MHYLINKKNQKIAYNKVNGRKPGIIFIHGYNSNMDGKKAKEIERFAKKEKISFIRFDLRGHGKSDGNFEDLVISDWKQDVLDIIDHKTSGQQIIIGSSMGGWLMLLAAKFRKNRIKGLIAIAPAPDFTKDIYSGLTKKRKEKIKKYGLLKLKKWNFNYVFTKRLFTDGKKNFVVKNKLNYKRKIILIHGLKDDVVSIESSFKIMEKISGKNIILKIIKDGDHQLSSKNHIKVILQSIKEIMKK